MGKIWFEFRALRPESDVGFSQLFAYPTGVNKSYLERKDENLEIADHSYPWIALSCRSCSEWRRPFILLTLSSLASIFLARLSAVSSSAHISASSLRFFSERITSRRESSQILSEAADFLSVAEMSSAWRLSQATFDSCGVQQLIMFRISISQYHQTQRALPTVLA